MRLRPTLIFALTLLAASPAAAQVGTGDVREEADRTRPYREPSLLSAHAQFGELGEDFFLSMVFRLNYNQDTWGIGLQLPLRFRLKDRDPQDQEVAGLLRKEDWDQPADFLKFMHYVYFGDPSQRGPYYVEAGALINLTIGHGTIMHRYYNTTDINRWRAGAHARTTIEGFTIEAMMGDVLAPYLMGTRVGVKPMVLERGYAHRWYDDFEIGSSFFTDWTAPLALERDMDGAIALDDNFLPQASEQQNVSMFGLDLGLPIKLGKRFVFTPYIDFNKLSVVKNGYGLHLGSLWELVVPRGLDHPFEALLRVEYRRVSGDYLGQYFNTVYEIERYQRLQSRGGRGQTKLRALCNAVGCDGDAPPARNGLWLELALGLRDVFYVGGEYLAYDQGRDDGSFRLFFELPYFQYMQFKAFYYRINTQGLGDVFSLDDDRTAILTEVRVPFLWVLSANVRWIRVWRANDEGYESVDDWNAGLGVYIRL